MSAGYATNPDGGQHVVSVPVLLERIGSMDDLPWSTCQGANHQYPCGLWQIFHMLSVRTPGSSSVRVMQLVRATVSNFFGCQDCQMHFAKATKTLESDIDTDESKAARSAALYLWGIHNRVNVRLAPQWNQDVHEVLYPNVKSCRECRSRNAAGSRYADQEGFWNEDQIYEFLVKTYGSRGITTAGHALKDLSVFNARPNIQKSSFRGTSARQRKSDVLLSSSSPSPSLSVSLFNSKSRSLNNHKPVRLSSHIDDQLTIQTALGIADKQTPEPEDSLPILVAFTSFTFILLATIMACAIVFVLNIVGVCKYTVSFNSKRRIFCELYHRAFRS